MKYKVEITETIQRIVEVDADNEIDALQNVKNQYHQYDLVLDVDNYRDTSIKIVNPIA